MNKNRTHDKNVYIDESRYKNPKELHKFILEVADGVLTDGADYKVLDVGCAAGEFLYNLNQKFPLKEITGIDYVPELIAKARHHVPEGSFKVGSVLETESATAKDYDIVFCIGVLGIFDEFEPVLENLINWTRPGGNIFVSWMFNDWPLDVWVKYRNVKCHPIGHRESGWNIFSKASIENYLNQKENISDFSFSKFQIPIDLKPHKDDPARTWTFCDETNNRLITNGLCLLVNDQVLHITLKS